MFSKDWKLSVISVLGSSRYFRRCWQRIVSRMAERFEVAVEMIVKTLFLQKLPVAFNQIQVRRITLQKLQRDAKLHGKILDKLAMLITGVVQHDDDAYCFANLCNNSQTVVALM